MEVIRTFIFITSFFIISACSNSHELETGEIKTLQFLSAALNEKNKSQSFPDARLLLNREQINSLDIPILFVELETGQNGTLTQYPGQGIGQTWLGADGATITLEQGIIKATRGLGDDIMAGKSFMPSWTDLNLTSRYIRKLSYLSGNNSLITKEFSCQIKKKSNKKTITIWEIQFTVKEFEEICKWKNKLIKNVYYVDEHEIVRKSWQYHSDTLGYLVIERLDL